MCSTSWTRPGSRPWPAWRPRAQAILWVEPGSRDVSRALSGWHDRLAADFQRVGPCTHQRSCPMLAPENGRHWCHFFAPPPGQIFADANWAYFGRRAGVDLRSLPYSFLALDRAPARLLPPGYSRVIGRTETFKPYVRLLNCDAEGLEELIVQKRDDPALYKELGRTKAPLVYAWRRDGAKIKEAVQTLDSAPLP